MDIQEEIEQYIKENYKFKCKKILSNGQRCKFAAKDDLDYCGKHLIQHNKKEIIDIVYHNHLPTTICCPDCPRFCHLASNIDQCS